MSINQQNITGTLVILEQSSDWELWLQVIRQKAMIGRIWKYCDISKAKEELPQLKEPLRPQPSDFNADATTVAELRGDDRAIYQDSFNHYRDELQFFRKQEDALNTLSLEITTTVAKHHLYLIKRWNEIYD